VKTTSVLEINRAFGRLCCS